jgi:hypothetical protein
MSSITWVGANPANFNASRAGYKVNGIVIHTIVGTIGSADAAFNNPGRQASAHYGITLDGSPIHQYVKESDTAWHCGRYYPDAANPFGNVNTIGIEHADNGDYNGVRPDILYLDSSQLVKEICQRYGIPIDRAHIRKHKEVADANNPTACPDALDIDRIVAMAAGLWGAAPGSITQEEDMLYVGPLHAVTGSAKVFVAGNAYKDPAASALVAHPLAAGVAVPIVGWRWTNSPVQSSDLDGQGHAGPDLLWWKAADGTWIADAILDTTMFAGIPQGLALSTLPANEPMSTYFSSSGAAGGIGPTGPPGPAGPAGKDGAPGKDGVSPTTGTIAGPIKVTLG